MIAGLSTAEPLRFRSRDSNLVTTEVPSRRSLRLTCDFDREESHDAVNQEPTLKDRKARCSLYEDFVCTRRGLRSIPLHMIGEQTEVSGRTNSEQTNESFLTIVINLFLTRGEAVLERVGRRRGSIHKCRGRSVFPRSRVLQFKAS